MIRPKNIGKKGNLPKQCAIPAFYGTDKAKKARKSNVVSYMFSPFGVNLPCGMNMHEEKVKYVCNELLKYIKITKLHMRNECPLNIGRKLYVLPYEYN